MARIEESIQKLLKAIPGGLSSEGDVPDFL